MSPIGAMADGARMNTQLVQRKRRGLFAKGTGTHERMQIPEDDQDIALEDELAQIVHDLKNPLASIALEIELMDARTPAGEHAASIERIRRNVGYLDRLIYNMMDGCMVSRGKLALRRARCDLGGLLLAVIDRVVPTPERHRVVLEVADPAEVFVDELRIERVVANLLDNALKYTPASAGIVVRLSLEVYGAQVSVCDAGPGLSPTETSVVFEPYRRAATGRRRPGSGLGLYVSKQIIEAHGGHIGVESVRGVGARFFFGLPLA